MEELMATIPEAEAVILFYEDDANKVGVKIISLNENKGPAKARNTAIKAAKGKYLAFIDGDDLWTENKLKLQIEFMIKNNYDFCIGVAGYPEGHPESKNIEEDIRNLKIKVDAGGDFIVTQLFFNNDDFFRFEEMARKAGIEVPIIPGIMPITNFGQIERFTGMCGASIPDMVRNDLMDIKDDADEVAEYGTEYALRQCNELLERGVAGIHFYTLNKSMATITILRALHLSDS